MAVRYAARDLVDFATALLVAAGLDRSKAAATAELLTEADLMGHTTHGLQLLPPNLKGLEDGSLARTGEPVVIADAPAALVWDGNRLPGLWLAAKAVDTAVERAARLGTACVSIRRSGHIGCLAAFLERATRVGQMVVIASSDPSAASVAPYGGKAPLYTPDPIAIGIPTDADPILIDISASITTNGMSGRVAAGGGRMPHAWYLDADGRPTDDPSVLTADPPGTILPVGGLDHGHKGYGLALTIESLTQGLSGFGRVDAPRDWGAAVFVQAFAPALMGGLDGFTRQTGWLARACRANPPRPGVEAVRVPGDAALARKRHALAQGVELHPGIMPALAREAGRLGVVPPRPLAG